MIEKHTNLLPDQVMYRHLREKYSLVNEVTLRKSNHTSSEKPEETMLLKEEVTDIIFKSALLFTQLKQI